MKKIIYERRGETFVIRKLVNGIEVDNAAFTIGGGVMDAFVSQVVQQARDAGWEVEIKWDSKAA